MASPPATPFFGRARELEQVMEALERRRGLRLGFRGIGGIGKSRLLRQLHAAAHQRAITPYVLFLDLDAAPLSQDGTPQRITNPLQLFQALLVALEQTGKTRRRRWLIFSTDTLAECKAVLARKRAERMQQINVYNTANVSASQHSTASNITIKPEINVRADGAHEQDFEDLLQAFRQAATSKLPAAVASAENGRITKSPFLVICVDNVDRSSRLVQQALSSLHTGSFAQHCILICAGREEDQGAQTDANALLTAELGSLDAEAVAAWLAAIEREHTELARAITEFCQGVPLLIQLSLAEVQLAGEQGTPISPADFRPLKDTRHHTKGSNVAESFLLNRYIQRLEAGSEADRQRSRLIRSGCILRRFDPLEVVRELGIIAGDVGPLLQDLQQRGFLTDRRLHDVIRQAALLHLMREEPREFARLCAEMERYYQQIGRPEEVLYARLLADETKSGREILTFVEAALGQRDTEGAAKIIAVAQDAPTSEDRRWYLALAKADIALAEGVAERAARRLQALVSDDESDQARLALLKERIALVLQQTQQQSAITAQLALWLYGQREPVLAQLSELMALADRLSDQYLYQLAAQAYTTARSWAQALNDKSAEVKALNGLGKLARWQDEFAVAQQYYTQALALSRQIENRLGQATALLGLGQVAQQRDALAAAEQHYTQALELYCQIENRLGQATVLNGLGEVAQRRDELAAAEQHYTQALELYRQIENRLGQANALNGLGEVARRRDELATAEQHYTRALELYRQIENRLGQANALRGLGHVAFSRKRFWKAEEYYLQARDLSRQVEDRLGQANALRGLGHVAQQTGDLSAAEQYYTQALELYRQIEHRLGHASALLGLGQVARRRMDLPKADNYFRWAYDLFEQIDDRAEQAAALFSRADVARADRRIADAIMLAQSSLKIYAEKNDRGMQIRLYTFLAEIEEAQGHAREAERYREQAQSLQDSQEPPPEAA